MNGCPNNLAVGHLLMCLRPLQRALRAAIALRAAGAERLQEAGARGDAITREHAEALLSQLDDIIEHRSISAGRVEPDEVELMLETRLRQEAEALGTRLPLDRLTAELGLDDFEREVLVLCAAVELDVDFERVLAYVQDDVGRRVVSTDLACALTADSLRERVRRRGAVGPFGRLRRLGLVATTACETSLREELRLTPLCLACLLGTGTDVRATFCDPAEVELASATELATDESLVAHAAEALAAGRVEVIGIWGRPSDARDVIARLATSAGKRVRRLATAATDVRTALAAAAALDTLLWIDLDAIGERVPDGLLELCRSTRVALLLTALQPWRPSELLASRNFVELETVELSAGARRALWTASLPEVSEDELDRIAGAFRFDATEVRAASRVARTTAALRSNGVSVSAAECLKDACNAVARKQGERHTTLVRPRRGPEDLILPLELHARVMEIAHDARALPRVMNDWGLARRVTGGGIKALFTGDSGTGKTLAAEVVAADLGLPLLRVDLARVVSKWIGETEKNLDAAFEEALGSHAVLFFDEAEALFGARGEVRHGTDRYANLEVSYLLQRLESHPGVVILASNLRDKIDVAFMRRFQVVVGFPRPNERERLRMWMLALAPPLPVDDAIDLALLARLDLTGAGVVSAVQSAALFAARHDESIGMAQLVRGVVRQFQREGRVLTARELGAHAAHMGAS
jgi:hypothetical protein